MKSSREGTEETARGKGKLSAAIVECSSGRQTRPDKCWLSSKGLAVHW